MKSRISFFDKTVFRKNLTRFAPAWGLCAVWLVLAVFISCTWVERGGSNLLEMGHGHSLFMLFYAPLCTQLLFGDLLYNTRMCNALHAMPLRRETWYVTNVLSGFVLFLIPAVTGTVAASLILWAGGYPGNPAVAPLWLLTVTLQFACFFGISTFSAFFAGSRFAHVVVCCLLNFGSMILYWMVDNLYTPMFYGVHTNEKIFFLFSPLVRMMEEPFLSVEYRIITESDFAYRSVDTNIILLGDNFTYCFIAAAVGLLLILGGLWLYRRRNLECAGDFIAIPGMKPVFSLVYTLAVGTFFALISDGLFLLVGLIVGWFTSQMLLERTGRVFRKKNFGRCAALIGVFYLTVLIALLDPFGIESWIPEGEKVESVSIAEGHYGYNDTTVTLEEQADIENVIAIHRDCLEAYQEDYDRWAGDDLLIAYEDLTDEDSIALTFSYKLKNGHTVNRYYYVRGEENLRYMQKLFSSPEAVFGETLTEAEFLDEYFYVTIRDTQDSKKTNVFNKADLATLYQAILADCEAGTMGQTWTWHDYGDRLYILEFGGEKSVNVYLGCENTLQWLRDYGLDVDGLIEKKAGKNG